MTKKNAQKIKRTNKIEVNYESCDNYAKSDCVTYKGTSDIQKPKKTIKSEVMMTVLIIHVNEEQRAKKINTERERMSKVEEKYK